MRDLFDFIKTLTVGTIPIILAVSTVLLGIVINFLFYAGLIALSVYAIYLLVTSLGLV
jgi:hypothetical protein